jgi:hypothetical protein
VEGMQEASTFHNSSRNDLGVPGRFTLVDRVGRSEVDGGAYFLAATSCLPYTSLVTDGLGVSEN